MMALLGVGVLVNPAVINQASCISSGVTVGPVPDSLTVTVRDGSTFALNRQQLTHAATIINTGATTPGVGRDGIIIAILAALTESTLRQLANTGTYPESGDYPNDGNGSDHDSLGLFQLRPQSGWGTVAELMDPAYQARAFYGGPDAPSPRGLLDIPGWQQMDKGEAAQAVEVSAFPDRYQNYEPAARTILDALTVRRSDNGTAAPGETNVPETVRLVFPLPTGSYIRTDSFGPRLDPITGEARMHSGTDWATPDGTSIFALADGLVTYAGMVDGFSGQITIEHTIDGERVATKYLHMGLTASTSKPATVSPQGSTSATSDRQDARRAHISTFKFTPAEPPPRQWMRNRGSLNMASRASTRPPTLGLAALLSDGAAGMRRRVDGARTRRVRTRRRSRGAPRCC